MSIPPPDKVYDPPQIVAAPNVQIHIIGYIDDESDCEVLATGEGRFFRFYMPKTSRVIRKFWQHIGAINVLKLEDGAYESKVGLGPFQLTGMAIGEDLPVDDGYEEGVVSLGTTVLVGVQLEG